MFPKACALSCLGFHIMLNFVFCCVGVGTETNCIIDTNISPLTISSSFLNSFPSERNASLHIVPDTGRVEGQKYPLNAILSVIGFSKM
jgi:hypothetical protein